MIGKKIEYKDIGTKPILKRILKEDFKKLEQLLKRCNYEIIGQQ